MGKASAYIVDPDGNSRNRVRHAIIEFGEFGDIQFSGSLDDARKAIALGASFDIIFVSHRFEDAPVAQFVKRCKETTAGRDATYVVILHTKEHSHGGLALKYALGVDGFLLEPYSSEQILTIIDLSVQVRLERAQLRNRVGLTLLVTDLIDQVNLIAFLKSCNFDVTSSMKKLSDLSKGLRELPEDARAVYFEVVQTLFPEAPFPRHLQSGGEEYRGLSDRVRKRMERKIINELESLKFQGFKPSELPAQSDEKPARDTPAHRSVLPRVVKREG